MSVRVCPDCGRETSPAATVCSACGYALTPEAPLVDVPANLKRGPEYVGGRMAVYSDRIVFRSHALNVQTGTTEILLREIAQLRPGRMMLLIPNRLDVELTSGETHTFVVGGRDRLIELIESQRQRP